jgi:hypothetical protein
VGAASILGVHDAAPLATNLIRCLRDQNTSEQLAGNDALSTLESMLLILIGDSIGVDECDIFVEREKKSHISLNITPASSQFSNCCISLCR